MNDPQFDPAIPRSPDPAIPAVAVIVLNYNGERWLPGCLDALHGQRDAPPFETLVVDNASIDRSRDVLARYPDVRTIASTRNLGFAGGNNLGASHTAAPILAFLNNDTIPEPDWLCNLHAAFVARGGEALVTSRIVFMDSGLIDSAGDGYFRAGGAYKRGHRATAGEWGRACEVFGACGAAFMISRALFNRLGGFDESFFMVYEDVDLSYRARLIGHPSWYAAEACVRHAGSATLGRSSDAAIFHGQRNLEWTWIKNTPWPLLMRTWPAHAIYSVAGVLHYLRRGHGAPAVRGKIAALAGLPTVLAQRRRVQQTRTASVAALERVQHRRWVKVKTREKSARRR